MQASSSLVGFTLSLLLHAGLAFALLLLIQTPVQLPGARPVGISISVFNAHKSADQTQEQVVAASEPASESTSTPKPVPDQFVDSSSQPEEEIEPEPAPQPTPVSKLEPTPEPKPEPTPEPKPEPTPEPKPAPAPEPKPEPVPEKKLEPSNIEATEASSAQPSQVEEENADIEEIAQQQDFNNEIPVEPDMSTETLANASPASPGLNLENDEALQEYQLSVRRRVEQAKFYPRKARRLRREGAVKVEFSIARNGQVVELQVSETSNHSELDRAALEAVKAASPFLPLPAHYPVDLWQFDLTLIYELN